MKDRFKATFGSYKDVTLYVLASCIYLALVGSLLIVYKKRELWLFQSSHASNGSHSAAKTTAEPRSSDETFQLCLQEKNQQGNETPDTHAQTCMLFIHLCSLSSFYSEIFLGYFEMMSLSSDVRAFRKSNNTVYIVPWKQASTVLEPALVCKKLGYILLLLSKLRLLLVLSYWQRAT